MVTTRSKSLSSRLQTDKTLNKQYVSKNMIYRPITRSNTMTPTTSRDTRCQSVPVVKSKNGRSHTIPVYATRSKRMNTRSNTKRFQEVSNDELTKRMTRSMSKFVDKYSYYSDLKRGSLLKCM